MGTKELKIVSPEGYEIDKENSTFEKIVFKKKSDGKPRTWMEYCDTHPHTNEEYCISVNKIFKSVCDNKRSYNEFGYMPKREACAFVAFMKLRQLRKAWIGDWKLDWNDNSTKYAICVYYCDIVVWNTRTICFPLSFPTEEMANEFIECFKDLLEQAKILL